MFFRTNSIGVHRLSVILGIIAGCFLVFTQHTPIYYGDNKVFWNLLNIALIFGTGFIGAWFFVRIIAWIIAGFVHDQANKS